ncbi:Pentatricopeptide repeat-containing protein [Thalictrum thalictroides]|uniref:Pentatricopeptide repeat-containing protein n=1 Tax=Thalictrum thalictroides TaxID=46969 RepID=A0A7J6X204_THATH|nr:Pentatricopeptide repeat-containing protein [Thalictrum thalictroides]
MLKGHCEKSTVFKTVEIFKRLKLSETTVPDKYTYPSLIKVCSNELALREGKMFHGSVVRCGMEMDLYVGTCLVDLYGKCREIQCARKVFDGMFDRNEVSWTAMIVGYLNFGDLELAQKLFDEMPHRVIGTWNAMIGGYVKFGHLNNARKLFDKMPERDLVSFTLLIDGYAKAGDMASAKYLFEQAPQKDVVAWSALISGYVQNGCPNEALKIFSWMQADNVRPDEFIMVNLMSACSQVGCLQIAQWVDSYVAQSSIDLQRAHVVCALVNMHAKCGNMDRATSLFEKMPQRDLISYCSMIQGLSIHGRGEEAVQLFARMLEEGLVPDVVAFTVVLTACSHASLVEEGCRYFSMMTNKYSITPSPDHYSCMVDLLGRAGQLEEAYELIKSMHVEPHGGAWGALLSACRVHGNIELGEIVAGRLFELEPQHAGNYVLLSNIFAGADRWADVSEVRDRMRERGLRKLRGCSWI